MKEERKAVKQSALLLLIGVSLKTKEFFITYEG